MSDMQCRTCGKALIGHESHCPDCGEAVQRARIATPGAGWSAVFGKVLSVIVGLLAAIGIGIGLTLLGLSIGASAGSFALIATLLPFVLTMAICLTILLRRGWRRLSLTGQVTIVALVIYSGGGLMVCSSNPLGGLH